MDKTTEILPFNQKKTDKLYLYKPLYNYISSQYGSQAVTHHKEEITKVQQHRDEIKNLQDNSEGSKLLCLKYAQEIFFLEKHFPINSGSKRINLSFSWYDSLSGKRLTQGNMYYEQASVLFNAAVIESQLGVSQNRTTAEGITLAVKRFKNAATIFLYIKDHVCPKIVEKITTDLTNDSLLCFISICEAHSQQAIVEKAALTKIKPLLVAKLSKSASVLYSNAYSTIQQNSTLQYQFGKSWINYLKCKSLYYDAYAEYFMSQHLHKELDIGKELTRLTKARRLLVESGKLYYVPSSMSNSINAMLQVVNVQFQQSEKENFQVYHERVVKEGELSIIEQKKLVKCVPIKSLSDPKSLEPIVGSEQQANEIIVSDPFKKLFPIKIIEHKQKYVEKIKELFSKTFKKAREHRDKVKNQLSEWGLPGSVLAAEQKVGFSPDIHQKIKQINLSGGVSRISELQVTVNDMGQQTRKSFDDILKNLDEEQKGDEACRKQFGIRWTRVPSATFTVSLRKQISGYKSKLAMAQKFDQLIDKKISDNFSRFKKFSLSKIELDQLIPQPGLNSNSGLNKPFLELKSLLNDIDNMLTKEEEFEVQVKNEQIQAQSKIDDILFNNQDSIDICVNKQVQIFVEKVQKLDSHFNVKEEQLLQKIYSANQNFLKSKNNDQTIAQREAVIQDICRAIDKYKEVVSNLKEGIQFYTTCQDIVKKLGDRSKSYIFSRNIEKKDLLTNIQNINTGYSGMASAFNNPQGQGFPQQQQPQLMQQQQQQQQPRPQQIQQNKPKIVQQQQQSYYQPPKIGRGYNPYG